LPLVDLFLVREVAGAMLSAWRGGCCCCMCTCKSSGLALHVVEPRAAVGSFG
jgi:hypothetical protein